MFKRFAGSVLLLIIFSLVVFASGTNTEVLNHKRYIYQSASENNPIEGYWNRTKPSTSNPKYYVNYAPTGVLYTFKFDSLVTVEGLSRTAFTVDMPLWKHWGVIGSYNVAVVDTAKNWVTSASGTDSVYMLIRLEAISANSQSQTLSTICDSAASGTQRLGGATWIGSINGTVDLTDEQYFWERLRLRVIQPNTANSYDSLGVEVSLFLPYSTAYMQTDYYKHNQLVK